MKCPHCAGSVGILSKEMNAWGKKQCPHCQEPVKVSVDLKVAAILFVPDVVLGVLIRLMFANFGLPGALGSGLVVIACLLFTMRLKPL